MPFTYLLLICFDTVLQNHKQQDVTYPYPIFYPTRHPLQFIALVSPFVEHSLSQAAIEHSETYFRDFFVNER